MPKQFVVSITEVGQEVRVVGSEWKLGAGETPDDYGYTPEIAATRDYERQVYRQMLPELDLIRVIAAVNQMRA